MPAISAAIAGKAKAYRFKLLMSESIESDFSVCSVFSLDSVSTGFGFTDCTHQAAACLQQFYPSFWGCFWH